MCTRSWFNFVFPTSYVILLVIKSYARTIGFKNLYILEGDKPYWGEQGVVKSRVYNKREECVELPM